MPPSSHYSLWSVPVSFHANIPRLVYTHTHGRSFFLSFPLAPNGARQTVCALSRNFGLFMWSSMCACSVLYVYTESFLFFWGGGVGLPSIISLPGWVFCVCYFRVQLFCVLVRSLGGERTCSCSRQCRLENLCRLLFLRFFLLLWLTRWTENPFRFPFWCYLLIVKFFFSAVEYYIHSTAAPNGRSKKRANLKRKH